MKRPADVARQINRDRRRRRIEFLSARRGVTIKLNFLIAQDAVQTSLDNLARASAMATAAMRSMPALADETGWVIAA